jgi:predicted alpha/beta-hydrolase family hydrolase
MSTKLPTFDYYHNPTADTLNVLLPGFNTPIDTDFMQRLIKRSIAAGRSHVAMNFPFQDRKAKESSGDKLKEEQETLKEVLEFVHADDYKTIQLIAKSLGGVVASFYLKNEKKDPKKYKITILGYIVGSVDLKTFQGSIRIIQGDLDPYGNIDKVGADFITPATRDINLIKVANADHSFRNVVTQNPEYVDEALNNVAF